MHSSAQFNSIAASLVFNASRLTRNCLQSHWTPIAADAADSWCFHIDSLDLGGTPLISWVEHGPLVLCKMVFAWNLTYKSTWVNWMSIECQLALYFLWFFFRPCHFDTTCFQNIPAAQHVYHLSWGSTVWRLPRGSIVEVFHAKEQLPKWNLRQLVSTWNIHINITNI